MGFAIYSINYAIMKKSNQEKKMTCWNKKFGFTLAEVLITLGIIGIVCAMTIPTLYSNYCQRQWVAGLTKFASTLQNAVDLWKNDIGCISDAYTCIFQQSVTDNDLSAFNQISHFMNIVDTATATNTANWLPNDTLDYYGNVVTGVNFGKVSHTGSGNGVYLLKDGMTFSVDVNTTGFTITVDVNGAKLPNRVGKDTFPLVIGYRPGKDIYYFTYNMNYQLYNTNGLCGYKLSYITCDPDNIDPTVGNGASPTAYTMLHGQIPDFQKLSQTVSGFKP